MPFTPENAPGAIYRSEYYYIVRGIMCRNSFHHYTEIPGAGAEFVNQMVLSKMIMPILELQSAYITPIQLLTSLITANVPDSYMYFFEGGSGGRAATPEDPRLGVYIKIETDAFSRAHYTGGCNIAGIGQDWTMDSPVLHDTAVTRFRNLFNLFVTQMGKDINVAPIKWVVFSRTLFNANPNAPWFWSERVSHIGVRRQLLMLRSRRARPTI